MPNVLVMAHKKPQSRKTSQTNNTSQTVFKVLGVQAFLVTVGLGIWFAGHYSSPGSAWDQKSHPAPAAKSSAAPRRDFLPIALGNFAVPAPGNADPHGAIAQSDFSRAFDRLDKALRAHGSEKPDQVLASANAKAGACPILWNNGEPSLALGESNSHSLNLPAALNNCADAVEKTR